MLSYTHVRQRLRNDPRMARVLHGSVSGLLGRGLGLVVNIIVLPLTLHYLGKQEYGIWVTISTSVVMLSVLDLGIANSLTNFIAEAFAEDDPRKAQRYFATAFWISVAIVLLLSPVCYIAWHSINWAPVFNLSSPVQLLHARLCVGIAVAFFLLSLPLNLANKVLGGYQQVHIANYFAMINSVLGLFAILLTITGKGSMVYLMTAYCAAMLVGTFSLNLWLCFWQRPWLKQHP